MTADHAEGKAAFRENAASFLRALRRERVPHQTALRTPNPRAKCCARRPAEALRAIVTDEARAALAGGAIPDNLWSALEEIGLPNALSPEDAGGFGVPVAEALSLLKVAGEYALPLPLADTMLARFLLGKAGIDAPTGVLTVAPGAELTIGEQRPRFRVGPGTFLGAGTWAPL